MAEQNVTPKKTEYNPAKDISWIRNFLDKHFSQMPQYVRVIAYVSFLFLFIYAFLSFLTMDIVFTGKINKKVIGNNDKEYTKLDFYYVEFNQGNNLTYKTITNNDENFYVTIPFLKLIQTKLSGYEGTVILKIKNGALTDDEYKQKFLFKSPFISNKFDPLTIKYSVIDGELKPQFEEIMTKNSMKYQFLPISSAIAGVSPIVNSISHGSKIYIEKIEIPADFDRSIMALSLLANEHDYLKPISRETRTSNYSLAVTPGETKYYYGRYYFEVPNGNLTNFKFICETSGSLPFFKNKSTKKLENIDSLSYDNPFEVTFENKVKLTLRLANPYEIVYFKLSGNETDLINNLRNRAQKEGFYLFDVPSTKGRTSNAIFASNTIPFDMIKRVIGYSKDSHIKLNSIQCTANLKTTVKNQIQIGYSPKYTKQKTDHELDKYLKANSNEEFRGLCDKP